MPGATPPRRPHPTLQRPHAPPRFATTSSKCPLAPPSTLRYLPLLTVSCAELRYEGAVWVRWPRRRRGGVVEGRFLRVMSFNVRGASHRDGINAWPDRAEINGRTKI